MQGNIDFTGSLTGSIAGGGGGGSTVSITPTLATGTKIADYTIDSESGSLYAPTPEGLTAELPLVISNNVISIDLSDYLTETEVATLYATKSELSAVDIGLTKYVDDNYQPLLIAGANININPITHEISASGGESIITETNSNGTYIYFPVSKVLICYKTVTETVTYSAWGSLYESTVVNLGNFAHEFKAGTVPIVNLNLNNSSSSALNGAIANITNTSAGTVRAIRPNNPGTTSITFGLVAYGVYE